MICMRHFLTGLLVAGVCKASVAQGIYNRGALVSITQQTVVAAPDSLVNGLGSTIINDGDLRISGTWINLGTYAPGAGQINFDSDLTQTINHSDQSFNSLTISGAGDKMFSANITIEARLDLQNGVLRSSNGAKIIFSPGAQVSGGSDESHVQGTIEARGAGDWLFPVGDGATYLPVEVLNVTDAGAVGVLTLHELSGQQLTGESTLTALSTQRYWELVLGGNSFTQSRLRLPLAGEDGLTDEIDLAVVAGSNQPLGPYANFGGVDQTGNLFSGSVVSEQAPSVTYYAAGAVSGERDIEVLNGVSLNGDGVNDVLKIINIEFFPNNSVSIVNRWGDLVFEMKGYNNVDRNFRGESNVNGSSKLPSGTYFYTVNLGNGKKSKTGYLILKQ